jgi:Na+-translocating ferredoxin:NAD+ oxidoreductase subunit D
MDKALTISYHPHIRDSITKNRIMLYVLIALIPSVIASLIYFRIHALLIILISLATAIGTDFLMQRLTKNNIGLNLSSAVTGLLFALVLPPTVPLWIPAVGAMIAVALVKYTFGPGNSIFNPALIARVFVVNAFPALTSAWIWPDGVTSATPLTVVKLHGFQALKDLLGPAMYQKLFIGNVAGSLGETSALAILIGAIFLLALKIIDWRIPLAFIGSVFILSYMFGIGPVFSILAGGLLLGAFFMATDYATTPLTKKGRLIFGLGCGILTVLIRLYSSYPEGVAYAILLMNAITPLIERYTKPRIFGT